jgi:Na+-translocating ferredoxin:NAD+ oxidoreductase RnfE subunit
MIIAKLILVIGFIAVVISLGVKNYKKDKYEKRNLFEYVIILSAIIIGAAVAFPYYNDLMPIALWSLLPGVIAALLVEARRKRKKDL